MINKIKKYLIYLLPIIFLGIIFFLIISYNLYLYLFYLTYVIIFGIYSLFAINQLYRYSHTESTIRPIVIIYTTVSGTVIVLSVILLIVTRWSLYA